MPRGTNGAGPFPAGRCGDAPGLRAPPGYSAAHSRNRFCRVFRAASSVEMPWTWAMPATSARLQTHGTPADAAYSRTNCASSSASGRRPWCTWQAMTRHPSIPESRESRAMESRPPLMPASTGRPERRSSAGWLSKWSGVSDMISPMKQKSGAMRSLQMKNPVFREENGAGKWK